MQHHSCSKKLPHPAEVGVLDDGDEVGVGGLLHLVEPLVPRLPADIAHRSQLSQQLQEAALIVLEPKLTQCRVPAATAARCKDFPPKNSVFPVPNMTRFTGKPLFPILLGSGSVWVCISFGSWILIRLQNADPDSNTAPY